MAEIKENGTKKKEKKKRTCKDEALFWLEYGDRTEQEMAEHLRKKEYEEPEVAETMAFLVECGFLDDARYASKYVEMAMEKGRSRMRVAYELKGNGVNPSLIDEAMERLYDRETEKEIALRMVEKALRGVDDDEEDEDGKEDGDYRRLSEKERNRILRRMASAGFSYDTVSDALRRLQIK